MDIRQPSLREIREVIRTRGKSSEAPFLWRDFDSESTLRWIEYWKTLGEEEYGYTDHPRLYSRQD